jgi:hypothetical protein
MSFPHGYSGNSNILVVMIRGSYRKRGSHLEPHQGGPGEHRFEARHFPLLCADGFPSRGVEH